MRVKCGFTLVEVLVVGRACLSFDGEGDLTVDNDGVVNDADLAILRARRLQNALDCNDAKK